MPKLNLDQEFVLPILKGSSDAYFTEATLSDAVNRQKLVSDILDGQIEDISAVVAFNPAEGWSRDVTAEIAEYALACAQRDRHTSKLIQSAADFIGEHAKVTEDELLDLTWQHHGETDSADHRFHERVS